MALVVEPDQQPTVSVSAVDDHPVLLAGLSVILAQQDPGIELTRLVGTVDDLLAGEPSDVVLLDLRLNDRSRPATNVKRLLAWGANVLVYTQGDDTRAASEALYAGASGIISKGDPPQPLASAIREVAAGETVLSPQFMALLETSPAARPRLSPRESEVLHLYVSGLLAKQVARRMNITEGTVKEYLKRIRANYLSLNREAGTRSELRLRAQEDGLLDGTP